MNRRLRESEQYYDMHNEVTEPVLSGVTAPIPRSFLPHDPWLLRLVRGMGRFLAAIINKVNQLLAFVLAALLLLLFTRFILDFFALTTSQFSYWVFLLSTPLVIPFNKLLPTIPYNGYSIDMSVLIAIIVYALAMTILRQFLKVLVARPR